MYVNDWYEIPRKENRKLFSANGVPWPLDEYLALRKEPTTSELAELVIRWGK